MLKLFDFGAQLQVFAEKRVTRLPVAFDQRVAIKLFDNPLEQQQAMWRGLRRLLLLNIPSPIRSSTLP